MTEATTTIRQRVADLLQALNAGLFEREQAINLAFLTAIAGESIFLLGPPGVGKSLIARRLKQAFADGVSFEYLMSKFSTPDEIFGPISIQKLKEEDKYERLTERYLPGANIVFLDEIWKAGPAIQNALLTILNEKIYRNGDVDMKVNIRGIITASNELPPRNQSLDPIWDRFLVRLEVGKIQRFQNFVSMIVDTQDVYEDNLPEGLKLRESELDEWSRQIDAIEVPAEVLNTIQLVMYKIEAYNARPNNAEQQIKIYDRRWKKIVRVMRSSAFLHGRAKVNLMDCFLMIHCLWNRPQQLDTLTEMVTDAVRKHGYSMAVNLQNLKKEMAEFEADVLAETQIKHSVTEDQLMPFHESYYQIEKEVNEFKGRLLTIEQFRGLSIDDYRVTNFYDENQSLVNRIKTKKGTRENTINVQFNDQNLVLQLTTQQREQSETIFKKPHKIVVEFWDQRHLQLEEYVNQQLEALKSETPEELQGVDNHLFVAPEFAEAVQANQQEVWSALQNIQLRLEKLKFSYSKIEA